MDKINDMNLFQQCWKNVRQESLPAEKLSWLNELNQAVLSQVEKRVGNTVKLRVASAPAFVYYVEAAGGYGVESHAASCVSQRVCMYGDSFEQKIESAVTQIITMIDQSHAKTVFFYTPILPLGNVGFDSSFNDKHMVVRVKMIQEETIDVV